MEYTKGEWKAIKLKSRIIVCIDEGDYRPVLAEVKTIKEAETNAHLIASAPDLYEACKEMVAVLTLYGSEKPAPEFSKMRQAIAKAEGGK